MNIALDVMGGDFGPEVIVDGLRQACEELPAVRRYLLVGHEEKIAAALAQAGLDADDERFELVHAEHVVEMHEKARTALRGKRDSSIFVAANLLKEGRADALVSAGHTGATVATTVVCCRLLPGVARPGIATILPSPAGPFMMVDVGANVDCKPTHLAQYAVLGEAYSRCLLHREHVRVGLLNVGEEEGKGNDLTKAAYRMLADLPVDFVGNVDGRHLFTGGADVIVCEGFTGNAILKACESLATVMGGMFADILKQTQMPPATAGALRERFGAMRRQMDHAEYGGALLLGVNGACVIAHGSSSSRAIRNALGVAAEVVEHSVADHVAKTIASIDWEAVTTPGAAAAKAANSEQ